MAGVADFLSMMPDTVTIERLEATDAFGSKIYGQAVPYRAYVEGRVRRIIAFSGQEQVSTVTVYVGGVPVVNASDRLTLPAGWVPQRPPILAVARLSDDRGPHHVQVYA